MATEIVTAKAGMNHVDSEDIGALYAGGFGPGRYALAIGENLKCTMKDANTLVIGTGGLMFDGRFVRVKNAEELTVTNGTQGQWRKDLAVLTYERDPSNNNIETVSWEVVRGTPAASESAAKAPSIETGSILDGDEKARVAVAEVDLNGLSPTCKLLLSSVRQLTETNKLLDQTRDSVSQLKSSYVRSTVGSGYIEFCRVGVIVVMNMYNITANLSGSWSTTLVGTVPEGFRPNAQLRQRCQVANVDGDRSSGLWIKPSGEMYVANFGGTGLSGSYPFSCTACWPSA